MYTKPVANTTSTPKYRRTPALSLALIIILGMGLAACAPQKTITMRPQPEQVAPIQPQYPVAPSINEARTLWDTGDTDTAAKYFYAIATAPNNAVMMESGPSYGQAQQQHISNGQRAEAWQYYAMACANQGNAIQALNALDQSLMLNPMADQGAAWQETWFAAASQLDKARAMSAARAIYPDANRPWPLRAQAGLLFALQQISGTNVPPQNFPNSVQLLADIYASATPTWRASLEQQLYDGLAKLDATTLAALRSMVHDGNIAQFPYNVIQLQYVSAVLDGTAVMHSTGQNNQASQTGQMGQAGGSLSAAILQLQQQAYFENPQLMGTILGGDTSPASCLILALPVSGPYAPIGMKIVQGASAAQWQMSNDNRNIDLHIINTESPSWIAEINALPSQCTTMGGPLQMTKFAELKASGATAKRATFAFMAQLNAKNTDEGTTAWRFFSSIQDQMDALLNFSSMLGIKEYGILAPEEPYGRRMTSLFTNEVSKLGGTVQTTTYPPKAPAQWNGIARTFLKSHTVDKTPIPTATFQAVFLPDSWGNMEMLVPNLFYHGEDRQVLLGTSIWAQGLGDGKNNVSNFGLAAFPSPWNPNASNASALALNDFLMQSGQAKADTWIGLGYDFVRFATALGVPQGWTVDSVNAQLTSPLLSIDWSMAPITWTADGIASQKLFLFKPTVDGYEVLNERDFVKRLENTRDRHDKRVEIAKKNAKTKQ